MTEKSIDLDSARRSAQRVIKMRAKAGDRVMLDCMGTLVAVELEADATWTTTTTTTTTYTP